MQNTLVGRLGCVALRQIGASVSERSLLVTILNRARIRLPIWSNSSHVAISPLTEQVGVRWGYSFLGGIGIAPRINAAFAPGVSGTPVVSVQSAATAVALDALAKAPGRCYGEEYQQGEAPVHNPRTLHAPEWFHQPRTAARCVNREAVQFGQKAEVSLLRPKRRQIGVTVPSVWILKGAPLTPPCFKVASHTASEPFE